jgi:CheY-like chemotaxis protein
MANILIIDDEQVLTSLLRELLESEGHIVLVAADGRTGMDLFAACSIDLVITDLLMPVQDGVEVIMHLRSQSPDLRILAMSGGGQYGLLSLLDVAKKLGADGTILKPFTPQPFLDEVRRLLAG